MKYFLLLLSFPVAITVHAQTSVKAYVNLSTEPFSSHFYNGSFYRYDVTLGRDFIKPSVAILFNNKKGNSHEFELSRLDVKEDLRKVWTYDAINNSFAYQKYQKIISTTVAARYEYIFNIAKKKKYILQPSLGFAGMPYFHRNSILPYLSTDFRTTQTAVGIRAFVTPRVNISLSKRLYLDLNIPIPVADIASATQYIGNPMLTAGARKYNTINLKVAPKAYTARIGFGLRF